MNRIYLVKRVRNLNSGTGGLEVVGNVFFVDEEKAWEFANQLTGVRGKRPNGGDWRNEEWRQVTVQPFELSK